jgi:hypothetical protein
VGVDVAGRIVPIGLVGQLVPTADEPVGAQLGIGAQLGFELQRPDGAIGIAACRFARQAGVPGIGRLGIARPMRAQLLERLARGLELGKLFGAFPAALARAL